MMKDGLKGFGVSDELAGKLAAFVNSVFGRVRNFKSKFELEEIKYIFKNDYRSRLVKSERGFRNFEP